MLAGKKMKSRTMKKIAAAAEEDFFEDPQKTKLGCMKQRPSFVKQCYKFHFLCNVHF